MDMDGRLPLILDGGESAVGVESTVVAVTGEHPMILRPGYVTKEQMEAVLGEEVLVNHAILEKLKDGEVARSPGMKYKHYAPKADVTILKGALMPTAIILPPTLGTASGRSALTVRKPSSPFRPSLTAKRGTASAKRTTCSLCCGNWTARVPKPFMPAARSAMAFPWPCITA